MALAGLAASPGHLKVVPVPVPQSRQGTFDVRGGGPAGDRGAPKREVLFQPKFHSRPIRASRDANVPKLNGKQNDVPKTENVPKPDFNKLQPAADRAASRHTQPASAGRFDPGQAADFEPAQEQPRPRTIQEALAQMQPHRSPGVAMKQDGGVPNVKLSASFDVKATPFGQYDSDFVDAVTYRWYSLLDSQQFALDRTGKVMLRFHLNYDGTITDMTVLENTVGDLLGYVCQKAINDPAPFKPWPEDMRRLVGANYREITFTFYYY